MLCFLQCLKCLVTLEKQQGMESLFGATLSFSYRGNTVDFQLNFFVTIEQLKPYSCFVTVTLWNIAAIKSYLKHSTVKTMDNVRGHFAAFVAFKTKNQCHIIILLFETLQFWFK